MPAKVAAKAMSCCVHQALVFAPCGYGACIRKRRFNVERVLVIHDNPRSQPTVRGILEGAGYDVSIAAFDQIKTDAFPTAKVKLVILDVGVPGKSTRDACCQIRATSKDVSILVLSAINDVEEVVQALKIGADDYITKPFDHMEFLARIRSAMSRHASG